MTAAEHSPAERVEQRGNLLSHRVIYMLVIVVVATPLLSGIVMDPVPLKNASEVFKFVNEPAAASSGPRPALLFYDFGPGTRAENQPQAEVVTEHLLRRGVPVIIASLYAQSIGFLRPIPERIVASLQAEEAARGGSRTWEYGRDWVVAGYRPGTALFLQALAKTQDLAKFLAKDSTGTPLETLPIFQGVKTLDDISFVGQFSGIVGMVDYYIQFLRGPSRSVPFIHGCTSITIPEAYIYVDSGQIRGLLEGVAGAAAYSNSLSREFPGRRADGAPAINTSLGISQLLIIVLILLGNCELLIRGWRVG